jgi:hypothetical protein
MSSEGLVQRSTVRDLIQVFHKACDDVRTAVGIINAAQLALNERFKLGGHSGIDIVLEGYYRRGFDSADDIIARMERDAWKHIVDRLEIWPVMSETKAEQLRKLLDEGKMPELNEQSVAQLAANFITPEALHALVDELIEEVFNWLRPRADSYMAKYVTNKQELVGNKVIRPSMVTRSCLLGRGMFRVDFDHGAFGSQQRLRTLENVFKALDGKGAAGKRYNSELEDAINASPDGTGETEYFRFKAHKNGNLHIEFLRADLLAEFNRRAGGKNLAKNAGGKAKAA